MTAPIRECDEHGFSDGETCPACRQNGEQVLSGERRRRLSKFASGALRHFPDDAGLDLDEYGWADYDALVSAVDRRYGWADPDHLAAVVRSDPKGRFEEESGRIRAAYGHSVDVELDAGGDERVGGDVPDRLYHGTDPANLDSILDVGLRPMDRQEVHLSESRAAAREVGRRHAANPVVIEIDAAGMVGDGLRVSKRGEETYTADEVPPEYLAVVDQP